MQNRSKQSKEDALLVPEKFYPANIISAELFKEDALYLAYAKIPEGTIQSEVYIRDLKKKAAELGADAELIEGCIQDARKQIQNRSRAIDTKNHKYRPSDYSESGIAEKFIELHQDKISYTKALGFLCWDSKRYAADESLVKRLMIDYTNEYLHEALEDFTTELTDALDVKLISKNTKENLQHAKRCRNNKSIDAALSIVAALVEVSANEFDSAPELLNTPEGIVNLKNGKIYPHDTKYKCSRITMVSPSKEGAELWKEFLDSFCQGDSELERYLQVISGSCAIGKVFHEGIFIAYGEGSNGKSTFFNSLSCVLGDYAGTIDVDVLTTDKQNKSNALVGLRGKRLISCGELEDGQRLSSKTLKRIASTDTFVIEKKYKDAEEVKPTHHIVMFSNVLPRISSQDKGTWRRIQIIPFNNTIENGKKIPNYSDVLVSKCGGAILQWIIEGAQMFYEQGCKLTEPECVRNATELYKEQENWLRNFINDRCKLKDAFEKHIQVNTTELYKAYKEYADETGTYRRAIADFNRAMLREGFIQDSIGHNRKAWRGIRLLTIQELNRLNYQSNETEGFKEYEGEF